MDYKDKRKLAGFIAQTWLGDIPYQEIVEWGCGVYPEFTETDLDEIHSMVTGSIVYTS